MNRSMHKAGWLPQPSPAEPGHHRLHRAPEAHLSTQLHPGSTTCRCRGRTRGQTAPLRWRIQAGWGPPQLATQLLHQHCHQLPRPVCVQTTMGPTQLRLGALASLLLCLLLILPIVAMQAGLTAAAEMVVLSTGTVTSPRALPTGLLRPCYRALCFQRQAATGRPSNTSAAIVAALPAVLHGCVECAGNVRLGSPCESWSWRITARQWRSGRAPAQAQC